MPTEGLKFSTLHPRPYELKSKCSFDLGIWDLAALYHSSPIPVCEVNTEVQVETFEMPLISRMRDSILLDLASFANCWTRETSREKIYAFC